MAAKFTVEKTDTGYSAYMDDYPVFTTGQSMSDLKKNMLEAYNAYLSESGQDPVGENDIAINFDLPQFFEYYKPVLSSKGLAVRVGMNEALLSQYVTGIKVPSEKQAQKILAGIRSLGKELLDFA